MNLQRLCPWASRAAGLALVAAGMANAATLPTAKSLAAEMGVGWNLGNTMELNGVQPIPTKVLFDSVKAAGFKTVRIPAAWDMHADQTTHVIDAAWMAQVKKVVDFAIQDSLFVILNIHWDGGWVEGKVDSAATHPAIKATMYAKQGAYWRQIATTFKEYDRHLLFASANEPAVDTQKNLPVLIGLHQIFIDTVRATGGNNASRTLILQGPSTSIDHSVDWVTTLPTDPIADRMMWEAHFYPYQFSLMSQDADWGKPFYYWGKAYHSTTDPTHNATWGEESNVDSEFNLVKPKFIDKNIPLVLGEFGALKRLTLTGDNLKLHILSRRYFYNYVVKSALSHGIIPVPWDAGGKGDGTMSIFDRNKEGAIYDLGLLNAIRSGAGLSKLAGDTSSDYTVATGANALRLLYSAKDSTFGQVNLGVPKANWTGYDSVLVRAYFKGTTTYDSAGTSKYGFAALSLVTMSKNWTWREASIGQLTFDDWKTYSIPLANDTSTKGALVPADRSAIDFFALQAYSHGYRGAIYLDWIAFKSKNGSTDTLFNFDQKAPEEATGNIEAIKLVPTASVAADQDWLTATTTKWGSVAVRGRVVTDLRSFQITASQDAIHAAFQTEGTSTATATLRDLQGRTLWSSSFAPNAGSNEVVIPNLYHGAAILQIQQGTRDLVGKVFCP